MQFLSSCILTTSPSFNLSQVSRHRLLVRCTTSRRTHFTDSNNAFIMKRNIPQHSLVTINHLKLQQHHYHHGLTSMYTAPIAYHLGAQLLLISSSDQSYSSDKRNKKMIYYSTSSAVTAVDTSATFTAPVDVAHDRLFKDAAANETMLQSPTSISTLTTSNSNIASSSDAINTITIQTPATVTTPAPAVEGKINSNAPVSADVDTAGGNKPSKDKIDSRVYPIAFSSLLMGSAIGIIMPLMPQLSRELNLSHGDFGIVVSIMGFTRLLANIPASFAAEKFGRRACLSGGPLISATGMSFTAMSSTLNELLAARFITGIGGSTQMSAAQLYLSDISTPQNRARTIAPMMIGFSIGSTLGPAIGGSLADYFSSPQMPFYVVAGFMLMASLNNTRLPETRKLLKIAASSKDGNKVSVFDEFKNTARQWKPLLKNKDMQAIMLLHGTYWSVMSGCMFTLMPLYATDSFAFTAGGIGAIYATNSMVGALMIQPAAWISDKYGRKLSIFPSTLLLSSALIVLPFTSSVETFFCTIGLWGVGAALLGATPTAYVSDISTTETRAQALALLRSAGDLGLMVGASTIGHLADHTSLQTSFLLSSALITAAGANFVIRARNPSKAIPSSSATTVPTSSSSLDSSSIKPK